METLSFRRCVFGQPGPSRAYSGVSKGLVVLRQNDWVADIGTGMTAVTVVVKEPTVMHQVLLKDFERWLKRNGRSPAETASRSALLKQLGV
jgi:hypothetical protein